MRTAGSLLLSSDGTAAAAVAARRGVPIHGPGHPLGRASRRIAPGRLCPERRNRPSKGQQLSPFLAATASSSSSTSFATMLASEGPGGSVQLSELLASCVAAAADAGAVIREVQRAREAGGQGQLGATLKDADDPRSALTLADTAAQRAVIAVLRSRWPKVRIIGEEEWEGEGVEEGDAAFASPRGIAMTPSLDEAMVEVPPELQSVWEEALCVFVDPLDGTREFVEGRLDAVQTLIGVSLYGRAVAGVMGLPFHGEWAAEGAPVAVVRGCAGGGLVGVPAPRRPGGCADAAGLVLAASAGTPKGVVGAVTGVIGATEVVRLGGVGNKVLALLAGDAEVGLMHLGTSLWDTCAPEALLRAAGGALTDLHGARIEHAPGAPLINAQGVLASAAAMSTRRGLTHAELAARIRASGALAPLTEPFGLRATGEGAEAQATDVARDLGGQPLSVSALSAAVGVPVKAYDAPEGSAVRAMMSEAVRLRLASTDPACPPSLFYKRVVMGDLEHARLKAATAPLKLARDVKSYQVEAAFLGSAACGALVEAGVRVARPYAAELRPVDESPIDSRFSLLLEDFASKAGWRQAGFLSRQEMEATLATAAKMHAFFWAGSRWEATPEMAAEVEAAVWPSGAYWQPSMQPPDQMDKIVPGWAAFLSAFESELPALRAAGVDVDGFGERLAAEAPKAAAFLHGKGSAGGNPFRTMVHGDLKSANVFLKSLDSGGVEAALIDFQWSGWGLAATDLAYLISSSASADLLTMDGEGEAALLAHYHAQLTQALVDFGAAASAGAAAALCPLPTLRRHYDIALLDVARLAVAYQWQRIKVSPAVLAANAASLARCGYNKSLHHALWLVTRSDAIMRAAPCEESH